MGTEVTNRVERKWAVYRRHKTKGNRWLTLPTILIAIEHLQDIHSFQIAQVSI